MEDNQKILFNELIEDLETKDERGKIITLQLYIQDWMDEVIKTYLGINEIKRKFGFWQKAKIIHAMDLIDDLLLDNILTINKLRNLYGHNRKVNNNKRLELINKLKIRPSYDWKGMDLLEAICVLTMMDLSEICGDIKKEQNSV